MFNVMAALLEKLHGHVVEPGEGIFVIDADHSGKSLLIQRSDGKLQFINLDNSQVRTDFKVQMPAHIFKPH